MASLKSTECNQVKIFKLLHGMVLQVNVSRFSSSHNAKVRLQLQNCSQAWILHWGCISIGNKKWFVPDVCPSGTRVHKRNTLCTPFLKNGDAYVAVIELRDPKIHAIEFVLKDTKHDKWLKMNGGNFHIELHEEIDVEHDDAGIAKCLIDEKSHKEEVEKPLIHRNICNSAVFPKLSTSSSTWQGLFQKNNIFSKRYAMSLEESYSEKVGEKSYSIRFLSREAPVWIRFPASVVVPFGVFERVLSEDINKEVAEKIACLREHVDRGDVAKLKTIQEAVLQMKAPRRMGIEVRKKMKSSRIPWPQGPGEETWSRAWQAMKKVWASKWNERAYITCRKANMNHDNLRIGILIQEHIRADYAFVTYTTNPVSQDTSEIYTEIVKGSGGTLVGASPGCAMSSITKKADVGSPHVTCYPSKSIGLYTKNRRSIIFRPDFVSEHTNGYTDAGIYDSVSMENAMGVVLDYSRDPMVVDLRFQTLVHSKIAEAAKIIEDLNGCTQDIEGVVQDGEVYVLRCKPLSL